jgi:hypothetical protein
MFGLSEEEWKRLRELQFEYNKRHMKIIQSMEEKEKKESIFPYSSSRETIL